MTSYDQLLELDRFIRAELVALARRAAYANTQRSVAYLRVLNRLTPIIEKARKVRDEFEFEEPVTSPVTAPPQD